MSASNSNVEILRIKELNLDMIAPTTANHKIFDQGGSKLAIVGAPGRGKSVLMGSILYAKKHIFPVAMITSTVEKDSPYFSKYVPDIFIHDKYDEKQLEKFIQRQKIAKEHLEYPWAFVILDDCTDDPSIFRKPLQNGLYKRGRHWKLCYLLSLQYCMDIPPAIRTTTDGVFIMRDPNLKNRKKLYENYASIIPDFQLFCKIMDEITTDFTALYIHNSSKSNNWVDCVFWYKAKPIPEGFKFGCDTFWKHHNQRYNTEYKDPVTV